MSLYPCSTWVGKVGLVTWQFLQSPEGGRTIAAIGGVLVIIYHVKKGVPGGRSLAALLSVVFAALLLAVMLQAIYSWDANMKAQCSAFVPRKVL